MPELSGGAPEGERDRGPVVVVSGAPGSGKTTYARRLSKDLGLEYFTSGSIFREMARRMGVSLEELSLLAERDPRIDLEIDRTVVGLAMRGGIVIDSHLAGWVLAGIADVAVLVKAHPTVRIARISEREGRGVWSVARETFLRESSQWRRFSRFYGYDITDYTPFDLVVDTSIIGPDETYNIIKMFVVYKLARLGYLRSPANL